MPGHLNTGRIVPHREYHDDNARNANKDTEPEHGHDTQPLCERQLQFADLDDGKSKDDDVNDEMNEDCAEKELGVVDGTVAGDGRTPEFGDWYAMKDG
jgi:hypothetical protein